MSTTIDERVVEMRFDNQQFERNVQTSLGTLGKLKSSLDLSGAAKGLENLNTETRRFDFSPLSKGVESVKLKFSALEVMATTALANITNSAVNAGKKIASEFTIEPIKQGFSEYETQINAVQTILANTQSKGTTLDNVNNALDELNRYADMTIYNFTEMTRNIGTFTAAGVDLDTSVSAIKGIANLAAVSGSTSQQASTAMYQLSQALASGTVKLQDWNSVVNAGMGGQVFQDALKETARAHGIAIDQMIESEGSFRETLKNGWLSSDILTETLSKFTGDLSAEQLKAMGYTEKQIEGILELGKTANDAATKVKTFTQLMDTLKEAAQSGWTQTWEILIGDFEEAKELWTTVSDVFSEIINSSAEARNNMLQGWSDLGGRTAVIESLQNAFKGLVSVVTPIKEAFREVFPPTTAQQLFKITEAIRDFTAKLTLSDAQAAKVKSAFKGLFAVIDIGITAIKAVVGGVIDLLQNLSGLGGGLLNAASSMGEWLVNLRSSIKETNAFGKAINAVVGFLTAAFTKIKEFAQAVKQKIEAKGFQSFLDILKGIWGFIQKIAGAVKKVASIVMSALKDIFKIDGLGSLFDLLNGGLFAAILVNVVKFTKGLSDAFGGVGDILGSITGILDGVKGALEAWQQNLKAKTLKELATAIAILAASLVVISLIDADKLATSLAGITALFVEMIAALAVLNKLNLNFSGVSKAITMMLGLSTSVLILASALKKVSSLDWNELAVGLTGMLGLMAMLVGAAAAMSKIEGRVMKGATSIVIFSSAIKILASACADMARLSWEELAKGLAGVGGLLLELDLFLNTAKMDGKAMSTSVGMIALAAAIKILASATADFAELDWIGIAKGLASIGVLLAEIAAFTKLTGNAKNVVATGLALIEIGAAMKIFASAAADFGAMKWSEIAKGLTAMGGSLAAVTIAVRLMPKNMVSIGSGLVIVSTSLNILTAALVKMGGMSWEAIAKGMVALGGSMAVLAVGLNAMKGTLAASAALTVAASSLAVITPVLKILGSMSIGDIGAALLALAGAFTVLGVATAVLKPLAGTMVKVAGAVTLFGVGCALAGAGILAVSVALTAFSASIVVLAASIGEVIVGLCEGIANSAEAIARAFIALVKAACVSLKEVVPYVADALLTLLTQTLSSLKDYIPQIVDLVMDILIQLFDKLALRIPDLVSSAVGMLGEFMKALDDALGQGGWEKLILSISAISAVFLALSAAAKLISSIEIKGALKGIAGFSIVVGGMTALLVALGGLAQIPGLDWLMKEGAKILGGIGYALGALVGSLVNGLVSNMPSDLTQFLTVLAEVAAMIAALAPLSEVIQGVDVKGSAKGIAGISVMIAGVTAILAALGGLNQIPGFSWLLGEGSSVLSLLGTAIGAAVGSIVQGLSNAVTSDFSEVLNNIASISSVFLAAAGIGKVLSMLKLDVAAVAKGGAAVDVLILEIAALLAALGGLRQIPGFDWIMSEGSKTLAQIGYAIGDFVGSIVGGLGEGITSGLPVMGENLSAFMTAVQPFIEGAKQIDASVMAGIGMLAAAVLALTAADILSGITAFLTGGSSLSSFGKELSEFGPQLVAFSDSVAGVDKANIEAAADAASAMARMASIIPNEGGIVAWFTGDNSLASFGPQLAGFGTNLKDFSDSVAGINPENIIAAAGAAEALAKMASIIPNEGGVAAWFAGENSVSKFGQDIATFGTDLKTFSDNVVGIDNEAIIAAATAAESLAKMASIIPNEGGVAAWFAGENSVSKFGKDIAGFGTDLKAFSDNVADINPENIIAAAQASEALARMASTIPNEGGVAAWFAGENSVSKFGEDIVGFGADLMRFAENVAGIEPANVLAAAQAGEALARMASIIPNEGGVAAWFAGENSVSKFGEDIAVFGESMKKFSDNVTGIDTAAVQAAATSGEALARMASIIPNEGGVAGWFAGENSLSKFGDDIAVFGRAMKTYSDNVKGLDVASVDTATRAGVTLAEMADKIPNSGGVAAWFAGDNSLAGFGSEIASFGSYLKQFADRVRGIDTAAVETATKAGVTLAEMADKVPNSGGVVAWFSGDNGLAKFGSEIASFGSDIKKFSNNVAGLDIASVQAAANAGSILVDLTNKVPNSGGVVAWFTGEQSLSKFGDQIAGFGTSMKKFSDNVTGLNVAAVTAAATAGKILAEMTLIMPKEVDPTSFTNALATIASGILTFTNTLSGANTTNAVTQVNAVLNLLTSIQTTIASINVYSINTAVTACQTLAQTINSMTGQVNITSYTTAITSLGSNISSFTSTMAALNVQNAVNQVNLILAMIRDINATGSSSLAALGDALNKAGTDGVTKFVQAFQNGEPQAREAITKLLTNSVAAVTNANPDFLKAGEGVLSKFIEGIKGQETSAKNTFSNLIAACITVLKNKFTEFESTGRTTITNFIAGVKSQETSAKTAFSNLISACLTVFKNKFTEFESTGRTAITNFITGVKSQDASARSAFTAVISSCLQSIKNSYSDFQTAGSTAMTNFVNGSTSVSGYFTSGLSSAVSSIKGYYSNFYDAGEYLVDGFIEGIDDNIKYAANKSAEMARKASEAAKKELKINSPSKVFYEIGEFSGMGFVEALDDYGKYSYRAGTDMAEYARAGLASAISKISDEIDSGINAQPTIRPVLDLSDVKLGARNLDALLSRDQAVTIGASINGRQQQVEVGQNAASTGNSSISFVQNNYSPKALSRIEIYRQTDNQISRLKGLVKP